MRRKHGPVSNGPSEEDAFELGGIFTSFKEQLINFTAKPGCTYLFADAAARMARLLEAEALRQQYRSAEFLPQMWEDGNSNRKGRPARNPEGMAANLSGNASGHRTLSVRARKAIAKAQRERWAKVRIAQGKKPGRGHRTPVQLKRMRRGIKSYWQKMTPEERSAEMLRRQALSAKKRGEA